MREARSERDLKTRNRVSPLEPMRLRAMGDRHRFCQKKSRAGNRGTTCFRPQEGSLLQNRGTLSTPTELRIYL